MTADCVRDGGIVGALAETSEVLARDVSECMECSATTVAHFAKRTKPLRSCESDCRQPDGTRKLEKKIDLSCAGMPKNLLKEIPDEPEPDHKVAVWVMRRRIKLVTGKR